MARFCVGSNIFILKSCFEDGTIFKPELKKAAFLTLLEILWNLTIQNEDCKKCFSRKTLKKLKSHKIVIRQILNKEKPLKKRRKKFLNASLSFKKLIEKKILPEFFENCVE